MQPIAPAERKEGARELAAFHQKKWRPSIRSHNPNVIVVDDKDGPKLIAGGGTGFRIWPVTLQAHE